MPLHPLPPLRAAILVAMMSPAVALALDAVSLPNASERLGASQAADETFPLSAALADASVPDAAVKLEAVGVYGASHSQASSPKLTAALLDTPQQITIVPNKVIAEQNLLNLRDILSTLPGITFGAGEGGGGYGDSINLRGFSGSNDITVDGVRDSA